MAKDHDTITREFWHHGTLYRLEYRVDITRAGKSAAVDLGTGITGAVFFFRSQLRLAQALTCTIDDAHRAYTKAMETAQPIIRVDNFQTQEITVDGQVVTFRYTEVMRHFRDLAPEVQCAIKQNPLVWRVPGGRFFFVLEDDKLITGPVWVHQIDRLLYLRTGGREWFLSLSEDCRAKLILEKLGYDVSRDVFVAAELAAAEPSKAKTPRDPIDEPLHWTRKVTNTNFALNAKVRSTWTRAERCPIIMQFKPSCVLFFRNDAERRRFLFLDERQQEMIMKSAVKTDFLEEMVFAEGLLTCT